jgi:hypothetical protein
MLGAEDIARQKQPDIEIALAVGIANPLRKIPCLGSVFVGAIQEIRALPWDLAQFPGTCPNSLEICQSSKCCCRAGV